MSFRFNWGTGIFIVIVLFLLSMAAVIYFSMQQRFDLVETGYYPQGLEYQKKIDQKANAGRLSGKITFSQTDGFLNILYPEDFRNQVVKGSVYLIPEIYGWIQPWYNGYQPLNCWQAGTWRR